MAYYLNYIAEFQSRITQRVKLELYRKDFIVATPGSLILTSSALSYPKNENGKFDNIISSEYRFTLMLRPTDSIGFTDLFVTYTDEWKVILHVDGVVNFVGFLVPGLGSIPFRDKPYNIDLTATDGLGLLKGVTLSDESEDTFSGIHLQIDYIKAILAKTNLGLNIRVYSSIVEESMTDRNADPDTDTLNQSALHSRTFQKDVTTVYDCYKSLQLILDEYYALYQWQGKWVVRNNGELQTSVGLQNWYTEYDSTGTVLSSAQDAFGAAEVGRDRILEPINITGRLGSRLAAKSVKTSYNYNIPKQLVNNEDLSQLGANLPSLSGSGFSAYALVGWTHQKQFLSPVTPITDAYIKTEFDVYNRETDRYYVVERDQSAPNDSQTNNYIRNDNEDFYVFPGDKIDLSITSRLNQSLSVDYRPMSVLIYTGGDPTNNLNYWVLDPFGKFQGPGGATQVGAFKIDGTQVDTSEWNTASFTDTIIPVEGVLIFKLCAAVGSGSGIECHFKDLRITYHIFIGGGYFEAKGDYWFTEQNLPLQDIIEKEVTVSDFVRKIAKGVLFRADLLTLTTPTWHRLNVTESRHYKELINLARYNNEYRRFFELTGTCKGATFTPVEDSTTIEPLSFHRHFFFPRSTELTNRYFILTPPLTIDHGQGRINATFVETLNSSDVLDGGLTAEQIVSHLVALLESQLEGGTSSSAISASDGGTGGASWTFTITGNIKEGDHFKVVMFINDGSTGIIILCEYTAVAGDTANDVAAGLFADVPGTYASSQGGNQFIVTTPSGSAVIQRIVTPGYNLQAVVGDLSGTPNYFRVYCGASDTVTVDTDDNGAGNSPTITLISNTLITPSQRLYIFRVEGDIQPLNIFNVHVTLSNGTVINASFTATALMTFSDGNQLGDTHVFKYIFQ